MLPVCAARQLKKNHGFERQTTFSPCSPFPPKCIGPSSNGSFTGHKRSPLAALASRCPNPTLWQGMTQPCWTNPQSRPSGPRRLGPEKQNRHCPCRFPSQQGSFVFWNVSRASTLGSGGNVQTWEQLLGLASASPASPHRTLHSV